MNPSRAQSRALSVMAVRPNMWHQTVLRCGDTCLSHPPRTADASADKTWADPLLATWLLTQKLRGWPHVPPYEEPQCSDGSFPHFLLLCHGHSGAGEACKMPHNGVIWQQNRRLCPLISINVTKEEASFFNKDQSFMNQILYYISVMLPAVYVVKIKTGCTFLRSTSGLISPTHWLWGWPPQD